MYTMKARFFLVAVIFALLFVDNGYAEDVLTGVGRNALSSRRRHRKTGHRRTGHKSNASSKSGTSKPPRSHEYVVHLQRQQAMSLQSVKGVLVKFSKPYRPNRNRVQLDQTGHTFMMNVPQRYTVDQTIQHLNRHRDVVYAEPNYPIQKLITPDDPFYSKQWNIPQVSAPTAWNKATGSSKVKVCVIDTGIDYNHTDLTNAVIGFNAITNTTGGMDDNNHGSHCAGVIGATTNNSVGVAGINWNIELLPCKFLDSTGSGYTSDAITCINWCMQQGARISSNSWGSTYNSSFLYDAIKQANAAGHIFVSAAGNLGADNDAGTNNTVFPAAYNLPLQVTVAATDSVDRLPAFSNYGPVSTHLAAPGVNIYSTVISGYQYMSGTSMATPHVAGALALMASANPSMSSSELRTALLANVDKKSTLNGYVASGGRLNVNAALLAVLSNGTSPSPVPVSPSPIPVSPSPVPVSPSPVPVSPSPVPVSPSPVPVSPSPVPVSPSPVPVSPSPVPVSPSPVPVSPSPVPVSPSPVPVSPSPVPFPSPLPSPPSPPLYFYPYDPEIPSPPEPSPSPEIPSPPEYEILSPGLLPQQPVPPLPQYSPIPVASPIPSPPSGDYSPPAPDSFDFSPILYYYYEPPPSPEYSPSFDFNPSYSYDPPPSPDYSSPSPDGSPSHDS